MSEVQENDWSPNTSSSSKSDKKCRIFTDCFSRYFYTAKGFLTFLRNRWNQCVIFFIFRKFKNLKFTFQKYLYIFPITGRLWIYCLGGDFDRTTLQLESDRNWGYRCLMRYRVTFDSRFRVVARRKWQPTEMGCHGRHFGCHWVRTLHLTSGMFYIYFKTLLICLV